MSRPTASDPRSRPGRLQKYPPPASVPAAGRLNVNCASRRLCAWARRSPLSLVLRKVKHNASSRRLHRTRSPTIASKIVEPQLIPLPGLLLVELDMLDERHLALVVPHHVVAVHAVTVGLKVVGTFDAFQSAR